jgi:glycosyltransferase involved in cell wall biosynthesis
MADNPPPRLALVGSQAFSLLNFRRELILCAIEQGWQVHAFAPDHDAHSRATLQAWGAFPVDYPLSRTRQNPLHEAHTVWALCRLFRALKPQAVLAYFIKPVMDALWAARLCGVAGRFALIEGRGLGLEPTGKSPFERGRALVLQAVLKGAIKNSKGVFFLNKEDQAFFVENGLCTAFQARLSGPIGLDLAHFAPLTPVSSPPCFLMASRLLLSKGTAIFAQAAYAVRKRYPHVRFILLGGPDANPDSITPAQLDRWREEGVIECPGPVNDVRPWFAKASVFVLPSFYPEGVPRSLQEALAMGRPILTTDTPGCRDLVEEGQTGHCVPARDPLALEIAMEQFIRHPDQIGRMGALARRYAETHLDGYVIQRRLLTDIAKACAS